MRMVVARMQLGVALDDGRVTECRLRLSFDRLRDAQNDRQLNAAMLKTLRQDESACSLPSAF